jgi:type III pantothenate kinase
MMLCLDVGNTQIFGGVFSNEKLIHNFRLTTSEGRTSDEIGLFLKSVLSENGFDPKLIEKVGICSVVPSQDYSLRNAILKYFKMTPFFLDTGAKTGIKIKLGNPKEVGSDRIANAIAACESFPDKNMIIIDFGTATTVDAVTKDKEYLGGAILAGVRINAEALEQRTAKLPSVKITKPNSTLGKNTVECIQSGLYFGTLGAIREIVHRIEAEAFGNIDGPPLVIATGGLAQLFSGEKLFDIEVPELVLQGIRISHQKNL